MSASAHTRLTIDNSKSGIDHEYTISIAELLAVIVNSLPTSDPEVVGQVWLDGGVFTVSAGP